MKRQNAVIVAFLLLLLSFIILAYKEEDIIAYRQDTYAAHMFVYCDNFYRYEKNDTLKYPKILKLDILAPDPGEINEGSLTLLSEYNNIEKIEDGSFDNFTNLDTLVIFLNSLQYIDDNVLTKMFSSSLISLNLKRNILQNLPATAFHYLINLRI